MYTYFKDIPFEPQTTPEEFAAADNWLKTTKDMQGGTASFAKIVVGKKGPGVQSFFRKGCHYAICNSSDRPVSCVATAVLWRDIQDSSKELVTPFIKYVTQESWASRFILNRNDERSLIEDGWIISADMYTPLLQNICILSRHPFELPTAVFKLFNSMLDDGILPDLAYQTCFNSEGVVHGNQLAVPKTVHRVHGSASISALKNQITGRLGSMLWPQAVNKDFHYRKFSNYCGGQNIFYDVKTIRNAYYHELLSSDAEVIGMIKESRAKADAGKVYHPPNPFAKGSQDLDAPIPAGRCTNKELLEIILPYTNDLLKNYLEERKMANAA